MGCAPSQNQKGQTASSEKTGKEEQQPKEDTDSHAQHSPQEGDASFDVPVSKESTGVYPASPNDAPLPERVVASEAEGQDGAQPSATEAEAEAEAMRLLSTIGKLDNEVPDCDSPPPPEDPHAVNSLSRVGSGTSNSLSTSQSHSHLNVDSAGTLSQTGDGEDLGYTLVITPQALGGTDVLLLSGSDRQPGSGHLSLTADGDEMMATTLGRTIRSMDGRTKRETWESILVDIPLAPLAAVPTEPGVGKEEGMSKEEEAEAQQLKNERQDLLQRLFFQFDTNGEVHLDGSGSGGTGVLTAEKLFNGCTSFLNLGSLVPNDVVLEIAQKGSISAKSTFKKLGLGVGTDSTNDVASAEGIVLKEFRLFLCYVRCWFSLYIIFDEADSSEDRWIDADEFTRSMSILQQRGIEVEDANAAFRQLDPDGVGIIHFSEYAAWVCDLELPLRFEAFDETL